MGLTTKEISSSSFNDMISSVDRRSEYVENRAGANVRLNNFLTPYTLDDKSSILNAPCGYSNGVYASLRPVQTFGPELITNGDFATDTNWTKGTGWSISGGYANANNASGELSQSGINFDTGKLYKVQYTISGYLGSGGVNARLKGAVWNTGLLRQSDGTFTETILCTAENTILTFVTSSSFTGSIDNVSVKEVTDADFDFTRGSAATRVTKDGLIKNVQILSGELVQNGDFEQIGSELITNGDFLTNLSGWTAVGTNATNTITWEPNGVRFVCVDANIGLSQLNVLTIGKAYKLTCDVNVTTGSLGLDGSILVGSTINFVNGFNEIYFVANSTTFKIKRTSTVSDCLLDNVSVKEVGQNWVVTDGWSIENGKANIDTSGGDGNFNQLGVLTIGKKYRLSLSAAMTVGRVKFQSDAAGVFIFSSDVSSHEFIASSTSVSFRRFDTTTSGYIDNVSIIEITDDTNLPRIDYTDGTGSLLLEPQSTNLVTYSEDFNQWAFKTGISISSNEITSPDGTLNGSKIETTANGARYIGNNHTLSTGNNTFSVFAKKGVNNWIYLNVIKDASNNWNYTFDLENGVFGQSNSSAYTVTPKIEDYGNGWYRCSITANVTSSGVFATRIYPADSATDVSTTIGDNIYIYGAQLEALSYETSYIPTSGSTVTRSADVCNNSGSSDLINSTEGVLYAEIAALADDGTFRMISVSDGTNDNRVRINYTATNQQIQSRVVVGGVQQAEINKFGLTNITDFTKIALSYKQNEVKLYINGELIGTDTSASMPSANTFNVLNFDGGNGSNDFYGNVRSVAVFKEALTDDELAKITSTTQQEVFYEMRDRMLQINADYYEFGDYTTRLKKLF